MSSFSGPSYLRSDHLYTSLRLEILVFSIFTISAKLDPVTYVGNLISMNSLQKHTSFCYSLTLGQFQLKSFYCEKGSQNFASNVTLYPCKRSLQNHLVVYLEALYTSLDLSSKYIEVESPFSCGSNLELCSCFVCYSG